MQVTLRRVVPRVSSALSARPLAVAPRLFSNQVQRHDGRRGEVRNRRDWNDDFYNVDNFFNNWALGKWDPFGDSTGKTSEIQQWRPRSSITETKEGDILITAEMPGLAKEDISVDLKQGVLTIQGNKKEEKKDEANHSYSTQRRSFYRTYSLPEDIDPAGIKAKMEHGVLEIVIPKPKEVDQKSTAISIN